MQRISGSSSWLGLLVLAIAVAVMTIIDKVLTRRRTQALMDVALRIGLTFEGEDWGKGPCTPQLETPLFEQRRDQSFRNIMSGDRDGLHASFFDYSYRGGRTLVTQTVATFRQDGWMPQFELAPQHLLPIIGRGILRKPMRFESHPEFAKKYRLLSHDEEKVRRLFTPELLSFFAGSGALVDWDIEGADSTLVVYCRRVKTKPADFAGFIDATTLVAKTFFDLCGLKKPFA